jgi:4-hydroxybenzoate polyprenyltransferase
MAILLAMRPHQWAKNLLVFVPMVLAQHASGDRAWRGFLAFASFSACASAIYLLNDLADAAADRAHPRKKHRPIAAGELSWAAAATAAIVLLALAFALAASTAPECLPILGGYVALNVAYTGLLRSQPLVDVIVLSAMYGLRLAMGAAATATPLSPWFLAFSLFFFTSLAFVKRYVELRRLEADGNSEAAGRGYAAGDSGLIATFGVASGYVAVLVLALYMNSTQMHAIYGEGGPLWGLCPLMLYWVSRVWLLARRGELDDDPVQFALTDRISLAVGAAAVFLVAAASRQTPVP